MQAAKQPRKARRVLRRKGAGKPAPRPQAQHGPSLMQDRPPKQPDAAAGLGLINRG